MSVHGDNDNGRTNSEFDECALDCEGAVLTLDKVKCFALSNFDLLVKSILAAVLLQHKKENPRVSVTK